MSDLLALLGDEWTIPEVDEESGVRVKPSRWSCSHKGERESATHGCPESGRAPTTWSDVLGGYIDGMGRLTRCSSCNSCIGSGRTSVRDPWTDELLDWKGAPCRFCDGTGWTNHAHDCDPEWHTRVLRIHDWEPATVWGVTFDGRTVFPNQQNRSQ
jgi:hypothetical protein